MACDTVKVILECNSYENIVALNRNSTYEELVTLACSTWNFLNPLEIVFNYSCSDFPTEKILLTNEEQIKDALEVLFHSTTRMKISVTGSSNSSNRTSRPRRVTTPIESVRRNSSPLVAQYVRRESEGASCSISNTGSRRKLVDFWEQELSDVGQCFENFVAFQKALVKFAICWGFDFKYIKNDRLGVTACCEKLECSWRVHATCVDHGRRNFQIKEFNKEHSCGGDIGTLDHPQAKKSWVSDVIVTKVKKQPLYQPRDLRNDIQQDYRIQILYHRAWAGKEVAKKNLSGDEQLSFEKLCLYSEAIVKTNPGSYINFLSDPNTGRFKRFFMTYHAAMVGFQGDCQPLLLLDGTFLKGQYKGCLLAATELNGDNELFSLALTIVDSENDANWEWFLIELKKVLDSGVRYIFVSERCNGFINGIRNIFSGHFHAYCLRHLEQNFIVFLDGRSKAYRNKCVHLFNSLAFAYTIEDFQKNYDELTGMSERIKDWIHSTEIHYWCNHMFIGERYGHMYSNPTESFNSWILEARHLPVDKLMDKICVQTMEICPYER